MLYQNAYYSTLITGKNTGDNSNVERVIIDELDKEPNTRFVLIDSEKHELSEYYKNTKTLWHSEGTKEATEALEKICHLIDDRVDHMKAYGKDSINEHVFVCIDNMDALMHHRRIRHLNYLNKMILFGRLTHIHLIVCAENATRTMMTSSVFDSFFNVVCLEKDEPKQYRYLLHIDRTAPREGYCYVWTNEKDRSELVKIENVWSKISQRYKKMNE